MACQRHGNRRRDYYKKNASLRKLHDLASKSGRFVASQRGVLTDQRTFSAIGKKPRASFQVMLLWNARIWRTRRQRSTPGVCPRDGSMCDPLRQMRSVYSLQVLSTLRELCEVRDGVYSPNYYSTVYLPANTALQGGKMPFTC